MNLIKLSTLVIFPYLCLTGLHYSSATDSYDDYNSSSEEIEDKYYNTDKEWNEMDDCLISTLGEKALKMPIAYMNNGTRLVTMYPNKEGLLNIKQNISFKLLCAKSRFIHDDMNQKSELEVKCVRDSQLSYNDRVYRYEDFECKSMPKSELVVTDKKCQSNNYTVAEVGFRSDEGLIVLYKICFDFMTKNALYTWYDARVPYYEISQKYKHRPSFNKSKELYGYIDVNKKYSIKQQKKTIAEILKSDYLANKYILNDSKHSLSRGHLAAKADFYYAFEQSATFYYANVAPQWQEFNGDRWAELEKSYREALGKDKDIHLVVTGTYGSCMLPDVNDIEQSLFLDPPKNIPVPLFYWKIMYDLFENKGIVFLGMNNPYKEVDQSMFICENECVGGYKSKLNNSRNENDSNIFCCSIESFEKVYGKLDPIIFEKIN